MAYHIMQKSHAPNQKSDVHDPYVAVGTKIICFPWLGKPYEANYIVELESLDRKTLWSFFIFEGHMMIFYLIKALGTKLLDYKRPSIFGQCCLAHRQGKISIP